MHHRIDDGMAEQPGFGVRIVAVAANDPRQGNHVGIVRDYAQRLNLPTPLLDVSASLYARAQTDGLGDHDAAALLTLLANDRLDDRRAE